MMRQARVSCRAADSYLSESRCPPPVPHAGARSPRALARSRRSTSRPRRPTRSARAVRSSTPSAPTAISPRASIRSARRPSATPALDPAYHGLSDEILARIPSSALNLYVAGRDARRGAPGPAADVLPARSPTRSSTSRSHDERIWLREAIESRTFAVPMTPEQHRRQFIRLVRVEALRAVPAPRVPGREAVLDRGHRRDDPDARRGDRDRGRATASARPSSAWRTAAG